MKFVVALLAIAVGFWSLVILWLRLCGDLSWSMISCLAPLAAVGGFYCSWQGLRVAVFLLITARNRADQSLRPVRLRKAKRR